MRRRRRPGRAGFTLAEFAAGMVLLSVAGVTLARIGLQTAAERIRTEARADATDVAADVLEAACAADWGELTPEWAAKQKLPESLGRRLSNGTLAVEVRPEENRPGVKRVTARVGWLNAGAQAARPVALTALFADPQEAK